MGDFESLVSSLEELTLAEMIRVAARAGDEAEKTAGTETTRRADVERIDRLLYFLWYGQAPERTTATDLICFQTLAARLRRTSEWPFEGPHRPAQGR
jgi:hypothetical protein